MTPPQVDVVIVGPSSEPIFVQYSEMAHIANGPFDECTGLDWEGRNADACIPI